MTLGPVNTVGECRLFPGGKQFGQFVIGKSKVAAKACDDIGNPDFTLGSDAQDRQHQGLKVWYRHGARSLTYLYIVVGRQTTLDGLRIHYARPSDLNYQYPGFRSINSVVAYLARNISV
jgi:hypothetical protein